MTDTYAYETVQAINSGAFSGPGLNATVTGGLSFASTLNNGTVQGAFDTLYGMTSSNEPFLVQVSGIGELNQQAVRITIEVGGKERRLADEFLLATIKPNADRTSVTVSAYFVGHDN
ncbi:MAG: hypothetical protein L6R42_005643 [Xanthoria sp. 1 TBL-2021]|nr:MAG: hypothetical protein L6R42_005643 [Xanthoria sp. 1 TBL-2021]